MYSNERPITPRPATHIPITEPPENATTNASLRLVLAAFVVRLFDAVADHIPMNPAKPEQKAPKIKAKAIAPWPLELYPKNNKIATTTTKIARTRYSLLRNAIAPLRM